MHNKCMELYGNLSLKSDELVLFMLLNECVVTFDLSLYALTRFVGLTQFFFVS